VAFASAVNPLEVDDWAAVFVVFDEVFFCCDEFFFTCNEAEE